MGTITEESVEIKDEIKNNNFLILFNDEVNSFEHVIDSIIGVLGYTETRAEQLALLAHIKGKANLKEGPLEDLKKDHEQFGYLKVTTDIN